MVQLSGKVHQDGKLAYSYCEANLINTDIENAFFALQIPLALKNVNERFFISRSQLEWV